MIDAYICNNFSPDIYSDIFGCNLTLGHFNLMKNAFQHEMSVRN